MFRLAFFSLLTFSLTFTVKYFILWRVLKKLVSFLGIGQRFLNVLMFLWLHHFWYCCLWKQKSIDHQLSLLIATTKQVHWTLDFCRGVWIPASSVIVKMVMDYWPLRAVLCDDVDDSTSTMIGIWDKPKTELSK